MDTKNIKTLLRSERNNWIVVSEIQREYVWGQSGHVLTEFLKELSVKAAKDEVSNVGFLYSYYWDFEIHLIDGQQRFTTLLLLAFCCACQEKKLDEFRKLLRADGPTPAFSYRVRPRTEAFLSELFKQNWDNMPGSADVKACKWYFASYDQDMTIQSVLAALDVMKKSLQESDSKLNYQYVVTKVEFWYFNVDETSQGEELYITMNSRGEALTSSEQLKPLLFQKVPNDKKEYWGKEWDDWEEHLYTLWPEKGEKDLSILDAAMNKFIRMAIELETGEECAKIEPVKAAGQIGLEQMQQYYERLVTVERDYKDTVIKVLFDKSVTNNFVLLALLTEAGRSVADEHEYEQVYHVIGNSIRRGVQKRGTLLRFLQAYGQSQVPFYDFILSYKDREELFDAHELAKITLLRQKGSEAEELVWKGEAFGEADKCPVTKGNLMCVWYEKMSGEEAWQEGDFEELQRRMDIFFELFDKVNIEKPLSATPVAGTIDNSLIARTLLATDETYGLYIGSPYRCSMGYREWWTAILNNARHAKIVSKLLSFTQKGVPLYGHLKAIIDKRIADWDAPKDGLYYVLKYPNSLQALNEGWGILHFQHDTWDDFQVEVLNKSTLRSYRINIYQYLVYKYLPNQSTVKNRWLEMKNGLSLECGSEHDWHIKCSENWTERLDVIKEAIGREALEKEAGDEKYLSVKIPQEQDLIEEGVKLVECLCELSVG